MTGHAQSTAPSMTKRQRHRRILSTDARPQPDAPEKLVEVRDKDPRVLASKRLFGLSGGSKRNRVKSPILPTLGLEKPRDLAGLKAATYTPVSKQIAAEIDKMVAAKEVVEPKGAYRGNSIARTPSPNDDSQIGPALGALKTAFNNVCRVKQLDPVQRKTLLTQFFAEALEGVAEDPKRAQELPATAPLLWANRDPDRKLNPAAFTREVYGAWLGKGLTRGGLRDLDRQLYQVLATWITRHPEDDIPELTRQSTIVDGLLAELSLLYEPDTLRRLGLALQSRNQRAIENNK